MPNNLVFNDIASQLKVQMYGSDGTNLQAVSVSASGGLAMAGTVTVTAGTVTVSAGTVTVSAGTMTISGGTISQLTAGTVTIEGGTISTVSALTAGTVTISGGTISQLSAGTVTIEGGTISTVSALTAGTVTVSGGTLQTLSIFSSDTATAVGVGTATVDTLAEDTSTQKVYSFYVANVQGTETITAWLQIAPVNSATYYTNDSATQYTIGPGDIAVLVPSKFLNYTKLQLIATGQTATALCYYQAQS